MPNATHCSRTTLCRRHTGPRQSLRIKRIAAKAALRDPAGALGRRRHDGVSRRAYPTALVISYKPYSEDRISEIAGDGYLPKGHAKDQPR
jgi:hypothetical protein